MAGTLGMRQSLEKAAKKNQDEVKKESVKPQVQALCVDPVIKGSLQKIEKVRDLARRESPVPGRTIGIASNESGSSQEPRDLKP